MTNDNGTAPVESPLVVNGWSIYAHPLFLDQLDRLISEVEERKARAPKVWQKKNCTKRLAAIFKLITEVIPADPEATQFRQGDTLGDNRKHWFRAKFLHQYRLFFRFRSTAKIIVLAWVNDEGSLPAYTSRTDAYAVFKKMLDGGNPPDGFETLMKEAEATTTHFDDSLKTATVQTS